MKKKLNFTFLGTTQHRETHPNLLTEFHYAVTNYAERNPDAKIASYLFDGVGCVGTKEHPTPGTYTLSGIGENIKHKIKDLVLQRETSGDKSSIKQDREYNINNFPDVRKQIVKFWNAVTLRLTRYRITGEGIDSLMFEAILYLQNIIKENNGEIPEEINLNGFSRGADTCVRLAHILKDLGIKVNLFLVDPVPGPGRYHDRNSYTIPSNVTNCQIIIMANEHLPVLKPHDLDSYVFESMATKVKYNNFPGNHSSGVVLKPNSQVGSKESYRLVQDEMLKVHIERGLLPEDYSVKTEYALVGDIYNTKDLSKQQNYTFINLNDFKEVITYDRLDEYIKEYIKSKNRDAIFLQNNTLYYFDRSFKSIVKINYDELTDKQKDIYLHVKNEIQNSDVIKIYRDDIDNNIKSLVSSLGYTTLNSQEKFYLYCKSLSEFETKCKRPLVESSYHHRDVLVNRDTSIRDSELFLDEGHRNLFIDLFPNLNAWFFRQDYSIKQNEVIEDLKKLQKVNAKYSTKFENYFSFDINKAIKEGRISTSIHKPSYAKNIYGEELGCDSLSYLRASLRNVVNICRHAHLQSDYDKETFLEIKSVLDSTFSLPEKEAEAQLNNLIEIINDTKKTGIIYHEIRKIICRPDKQLDEFIKSLRVLIESVELDKGQRLIINEIIGEDINKKDYFFSWEKYVRLRDKAIHLQASLATYNYQNNISAQYIRASNQLSQKLIDFYSEDYGIPTTADKIINNLRSYQRWSLFFSYFPLGLGLFDKDKYNKVGLLIENLSSIPNNAKDDLISIGKMLYNNMNNIFALDTEPSIAKTLGNQFGVLNKYLLRILTKAIRSTGILDLVATVGKDFGQDDVVVDSSRKFLNR